LWRSSLNGVSKRIEEHALLPMVLAGMASVLWWVVFGDLRPYCWIQLLPMMLIPAVLLLYARRRSEDRFIILAVVFYAFAKGTEYFDQEVYRMTCRLLSGHSLKHLVAAAGCAILFAMLKRRKRAGPGRGPATGEQEAGNWQNGLLQARKDAP